MMMDGEPALGSAPIRRIKLSKRSVGDLKPETKPYVAFDTDLPAFGCEVRPTGIKSFKLWYRPKKSARLRKLTIGTFGAITAEEARALAKKALGDVAHGLDPASAAIAARRQETLAMAFERWLVDHVGRKRKPFTVASYRQMFESHIKPALGSRPLQDVARSDVTALHRRMSKIPYAANRTLAVLRAFMNWAERQELRPANSNPARLIEMYRERRRERLLTSGEFARLGSALHDEESAAASDADLERHWAIAAIMLLIFTGARRGEILGLRWHDIDLSASVARLPDSKTGPKTLFLSAPARAVLARVKRLPDNPHVICGRLRGAPLIGLPKIWERVRGRAGLHDVRLHDLRHAFASTAAMGGMSLPTIGRLLGHSQPSVTDRYAHFASSPLVDAADRVGETIAAQLKSGGPRNES